MTRMPATSKTTPERQPVPALITLSNATRARRPAGARAAIVPDPFGSHADALALVEPLGLDQPLAPRELGDLKALASEARAITDALISNEPPPSPSLSTLNRLGAEASANQVLRIGPDGTLTADIRWHAPSAVAELACRVVTELGRLDPARLRRCAREPCELVFYDTTRSRTQRWHSESPCGLRERQDRWRKPAADKAITG